MRFARRLALRWGIWDFDAWLNSIPPSVLNGWLRYAAVEPEAFASLAPHQSAGTAPPAQWLPAEHAAGYFAKRFGK